MRRYNRGGPMKVKRIAPIPYRPRKRDQARVNRLKELKVNLCGIISEALTPYLDQNFERLVEQAKAELLKAVHAPDPR